MTIDRYKAHKALIRIFSIVSFLVLLTQSTQISFAQQKKRDAQAPPAEATTQEAEQLEAVITTDMGVIRFEFFPNKVPKHTLQFIKLARAGFYDGSAFHRVIKGALIQGGDPLLKDPKTPREKWGTGGLNQIADEFTDIKHVRGTVSTVRIPGQANSGGVQFFICASPQPQIDGQYSAFGEVTEGIEVVDKISTAPADSNFVTTTPVRITSIKIEPKRPEPFKDATVDEMRKDVLLRTSMGDITLEMNPELAPEHVRNFLKLVQSGWYDRTEFHRVIPGFVIQGGVGATRADHNPHPADKWVHKLKGEFSRTALHVRGVLSMARATDPDSAETSFFIVLGTATHLDGRYTIFGKVVDGFDTIELIENAPRVGESPVKRIELIEAVIKQ